MTKYKFASAGEWLESKAQALVAANDSAALFAMLQAVAGRLDNDSIQDLFESEMDADGFFTPMKG